MSIVSELFACDHFVTPHCVDAIFPVFRIAVAVDGKSCTGQNHFPFQSIRRNFTVSSPKKRKFPRIYSVAAQQQKGATRGRVTRASERPRLAYASKSGVANAPAAKNQTFKLRCVANYVMKLCMCISLVHYARTGAASGVSSHN